MTDVRRIAWTLLLATVLAGAVSAALLWSTGYRMYAVQTGSMEPTYPVGSLLIERPAVTRPPIGTVITFLTPAGPVSHRVYGIGADGRITTKGDANRTADPWTVRPVHVMGVVSHGAARWGYVLVFFQQPAGILAVAMLALSVMFSWSLFMSKPAETSERLALSPHAV